MNLFQEFPEYQAETLLQNESVAAFGLTYQGTSHKQSDPPMPCQDCHGLRWMEAEGLFLAAIADGVGSCSLSHWGAYTAVNAALDSACRDLRALSHGRKLTLEAENADFRKRMKEILVAAFRAAQDAVEVLADSARPPQPVFNFQSTLTLAIYDGTCLYHGHAGDDGIVAQLPDGTVEMATRRMKGEEASSVYPLQSGESVWQFGLVPAVAGFIMATDGVLDAFVQSHPDSFGINYCNGICYAFMEDAMKLLAEKEPYAAQKAMAQYREFLQSAEYTQRVTDDLTLVAVVSPGAMAKAKQPDFSLELWNTIQQESMAAKRRALNHRVSRQAPRPPALPRQEVPAREPEVCKASAPEDSSHDGIWKKMILALLLVTAVLFGFLLGHLILTRQYEEGQQALTEQYQQSYNDLARQYQTLSRDYEDLKEAGAQREQDLQTAQQKAKKLEKALAQREQELKELRQQLEELTAGQKETGDNAG